MTPRVQVSVSEGITANENRIFFEKIVKCVENVGVVGA